jgi:hypothetical protein
MTSDPGQEPVSSHKWKLTSYQKKRLLEWIGEGLTPREINARASQLKSPFTATRQLIDYYRKGIGKKVLEDRKNDAESAFSKGFAVKEKRVEALNKIAEAMFQDICGRKRGRWLKDKKMLGFGETAEVYEFEKFNQAEIAEFRATLEDIAKETGDRQTGRRIGIDLPDGDDAGTAYKFYIGIDPEQI